jgi:hypothetical protein
MENLRQKLEKELAEHQRESGLHVIGGRDRLIQRLLNVMEPLVNVMEPLAEEQGHSDGASADQNGPCCA